jgi:hypothetical protein
VPRSPLKRCPGHPLSGSTAPEPLSSPVIALRRRPIGTWLENRLAALRRGNLGPRNSRSKTHRESGPRAPPCGQGSGRPGRLEIAAAAEARRHHSRDPSLSGCLPSRPSERQRVALSPSLDTRQRALRPILGAQFAKLVSFAIVRLSSNYKPLHFANVDCERKQRYGASRLRPCIDRELARSLGVGKRSA